jgi:hypothetical protein
MAENNDLNVFKGARITAVEMDEERLLLTFESGKVLRIEDDGQCCCESRYMTTDDEVQSLIGGCLLNVEEKPGAEDEEDWGNVHETMFVEVSTDKGFITLTNHNEHNGYYGGFWLKVTDATPA